ncbi:hypothetical protein KSP40_PGU008828 [Platanthera guangdongensis]|uniref:Uncharacterized protein n=1 Tax=Platanthera guangdongensis TaxID=2320717 RepID=A0ABR2N4H1_9ASPA
MSCAHDHSCDDHNCAEAWSLYKHVDLAKVQSNPLREMNQPRRALAEVIFPIQAEPESEDQFAGSKKKEGLKSAQSRSGGIAEEEEADSSAS